MPLGKSPVSMAIAILLMAALATSGYSEIQEPLPGVEHEPKFRVDNGHVNLGIVPSYKPFEHTFTIYNEGKVPLLVDVVKTSCACVSSVQSGKAVAPGSAEELTVRYSAERSMIAGRRSFSVHLVTNDPQQPSVTVAVDATMVKPVEVMPHTIDFGLEGASPDTMEITVTCYGDKEEVSIPEILSVTTSSPQLRVKTGIKEEAPESTIHHFSVSIDRSLGDRRFKGCLFLRTNSELMPVIEVPVRAEIATPLMPEPERILLGNVLCNSRHIARVKLKAAPGRDLTKCQIVVDQPGITATLKATSANSAENWEMEVVTQAGNVPGKISGTVRVLQDGNNTLAEVKVLGYARAQ